MRAFVYSKPRAKRARRVRGCDSRRSSSARWRAVRANVLASVDRLRTGSAMLEDLVIQGRLLLVGAELDLETGVVELLSRP